MAISSAKLDAMHRASVKACIGLGFVGIGLTIVTVIGKVVYGNGPANNDNSAVMTASTVNTDNKNDQLR